MTGRQGIKDRARHVLICLILLGLVSQAPAATGSYEMNINISGQVKNSARCYFTHGDYLPAVDFGQVNYNYLHIMQGSHKQTIASSMTCRGDTGGAKMIFLTNTNEVVIYRGNKLLPVKDRSTGVQSPDLAIQMWVNGSRQDVASYFNIDMRYQPYIEAELVQVGVSKSFVSGRLFDTNVALVLMLY